MGNNNTNLCQYLGYLINNKVTDGTEIWYQNIDNGKTPDKYPLFEGGIVYGFEDINYYSNNPEKPKTPDAFDKDENWNLKTTIL